MQDLPIHVARDRRRPFSELWRPYRRYAQSGEINSRVEDVSATLARVRERFAGGESDDLDGLTISFPDWWLNVRPSNTEPLLRLNLEARNKTTLERMLGRISPLLGQRVEH